jgi:hypothetical protein
MILCQYPGRKPKDAPESRSARLDLSHAHPEIGLPSNVTHRTILNQVPT